MFFHIGGPPTSYDNVYVEFTAGGTYVGYESGFTIEIYYHGFDAPVLIIPASELEMMHKKTDCPTSLYEHLNNAMEGDAIFCGRTLKHSEISKVKLIRPGKSEKIATSYSVYGYKNDEKFVKIGIWMR